MENSVIQPLCYCCKTPYQENAKFCGNCGYPFQASPEEQKQFSINYTLTNIDKDNVLAKIKEARILLFVISVFTGLQGFIQYFTQNDISLLIVNLILCGIYAGLGSWVNKKAFAAILTGGLLYVSIILLSAFLDPMTIFKGIIFKIIFIIGFVRAAYGAYKFKI